jgi:hypothetical protein
MEKIMEARNLNEGSVAYSACINDALQLLILTKAFCDGKVEKAKKA